MAQTGDLMTLKDGSRLHVRPIQPADEALLHEAFSRMSERTVYFRFFSPLKRLPDELAHRLAVVDYSNRYALLAVTHKPDRHEHIAGVARYDRAPRTEVAEVAVAVVDDYQRKGIGSQLLVRLAAVAREHGIRTFSLVVLPENQSLLGLLRKRGWLHRARLVGGIYEITFELEGLA